MPIRGVCWYRFAANASCDIAFWRGSRLTKQKEPVGQTPALNRRRTARRAAVCFIAIPSLLLPYEDLFNVDIVIFEILWRFDSLRSDGWCYYPLADVSANKYLHTARPPFPSETQAFSIVKDGAIHVLSLHSHLLLHVLFTVGESHRRPVALPTLHVSSNNELTKKLNSWLSQIFHFCQTIIHAF